MSRAVRRVPADWQHPKIEKPDWRTGRMVECYQPMFDRPFGPAMQEWYDEWQKWERGERPDYCSEESAKLTYWEWNGGPPDPAYYRPDWPEELARWLTDNNASALGRSTGSYEGWLRVARGGFAPSMAMDASGIHSGVDLPTDDAKDKPA